MRSLCCVIIVSDVSNYSPMEIFMRLIFTTIKTLAAHTVSATLKSLLSSKNYIHHYWLHLVARNHRGCQPKRNLKSASKERLRKRISVGLGGHCGGPKSLRIGIYLVSIF